MADDVSLSISEECSYSLSTVAVEPLPIGVDQAPGSGSNYPFVRPVNNEETVIGDLFLRYWDPDCGFVLPFRVVWLKGFGCTASIVDEVFPNSAEHILIVDAEDVTVFDTRTADDYSKRAWGPRAWIIEWTHSAENLLGTQDILRVVTYVGNDDLTFPFMVRLDNGMLDGRAVARAPARVTSLSVLSQITNIGDGGNPVGVLAAGYNAEISAEAPAPVDGGRRSTTLTLTLEPGLGFGRYAVDCDEVDNWGIKQINNIKPTNYQDFAITTEENSCSRIQRPVQSLIDDPWWDCRSVKIRNAAIQIDGDCPPCCSCDDFIAVYESVRNLTDVLRDYVERAHVVRDWLSSSVLRMEQQRDCRADHRLRAYAQSACPDKVACSIAYCNSTTECIQHVLIPISFNYQDTLYPAVEALTRYTPSVAGQVGKEICGFTKRAGNVSENYLYQLALPYVLGGTYPNYWAYFDAIEPYSMGFITFFIEYPFSQRGNNASFAVDAYALPNPPLVSSEEESLPVLTDYGYVVGRGPISAEEECIDWRLVARPLIAGAGILQEPCCVETLANFPPHRHIV